MAGAKRILTNRNFPDGRSVEWIEYANGRFFWCADDYSMAVSCGFVVDVQFVTEKFAECGRVFDPSFFPDLKFRTVGDLCCTEPQ